MNTKGDKKLAKEKLFYIGVKAMITDEKGQILLLDSGDYHQKHQSRHWDFPGGRIDVGEDPQIALSREMLEETGITSFTKPELFATAISRHTIKKDGSTYGLALMVYKTKLTGDETIKLSEEHSAHEWVDKKEAVNRLADKYPVEFTDLL